MNKSLLSLFAISALLVSAQTASAQSASTPPVPGQTTTSTTTTWTTDQGIVIREHSTTQHYSSLDDPSLLPNVGAQLPGTVVLYPLPETMQIPQPERYSYTIINGMPVVVERSNRKVLYIWK